MKTQPEFSNPLSTPSRRQSRAIEDGTSAVRRTGAQALHDGFDLNTILVPVDFSPDALHALDVAVSLARRLDASIVLVHVMDSIYLSGRYDSRRLRALRAEAREEAKRLLAGLEKRRVKPHVPVRHHLLNGTAYAKIVEIATKTSADLIVMGSQGRSGMKRLFVGSVAERVIRLAHCPVLIARRPKR